MKTLSTKRTTLRLVTTNDLQDIYEITSNNAITKMVGWKHHQDMNETLNLLEDMTKKQETYAIVLKATTKVIGLIGVHKKQANNNLQVRMLTILLNQSYWGQDYAYEVTKEILKYLFEEEQIHKVNVGHFSINNQSKRVIEKLGFIYEGTKREAVIIDNHFFDAVEYSMLKRDYEQTKN